MSESVSFDGYHSKVPPGSDEDPFKTAGCVEQIKSSPLIDATGVGKTETVETAVLLGH